MVTSQITKNKAQLNYHNSYEKNDISCHNNDNVTISKCPN